LTYAVFKWHRWLPQFGDFEKLYEALEAYTAKGLTIIPFRDDVKEAACKWKELEATPDISTFYNKFTGTMTGNIAVKCKTSNLICVDIDTADDGVRCWEKIVECLCISELVERTPMEVTTTGGLHFYFKGLCDTNAKKIQCYSEDDKCDVTIGIDSRSDSRKDDGAGGACRMSPSKHVGNKIPLYPHIFWVRSILDYECQQCPQTLIDLLNQKASLKIVGGRFVFVPAKQEFAPEDSWMNLEVEQSKVEGKEVELTIEQLSALLRCLKDSTLESHDDKVKLIWIMALAVFLFLMVQRY
jgi:hypothetical protein